MREIENLKDSKQLLLKIVTTYEKVLQVNKAEKITKRYYEFCRFHRAYA
ncbi:MAG: hypothetical protein JWN60_1324 [Acidobacteria bacterium]|jgi:hypothetical protein|nr:hypothetical protein [Acidobacteriota bacterium]